MDQRNGPTHCKYFVLKQQCQCIKFYPKFTSYHRTQRPLLNKHSLYAYTHTTKHFPKVHLFKLIVDVFGFTPNIIITHILLGPNVGTQESHEMHEMMSDTNTTPFNIHVYILGDGLKKDFVCLTFFSWTSSVLHEPNYTNVVQYTFFCLRTRIL